MKKIYQKPTMKVVLLQHQTYLLASSGEKPNEYDGDFAYMPSTGFTHKA